MVIISNVYNKERIALSKETPMMQQYNKIKEAHPDTILFFRLGDFYETFAEDAKNTARELEIALTARAGVPMAGMPYHAADTYIARLVEKGYKVAVCEQMEDPKLAKGLVKREVVRIITPGTVIDQQMLDEKKNNYLISLATEQTGFGMAIIDVSTGVFNVTAFNGETAIDDLKNEIARLHPKECILNSILADQPILQHFLSEQLKIIAYPYEDRAFEYKNAYNKLLEHFNVASLEGFGCQEITGGIKAAGALISYLEETQKVNLMHINRLTTYDTRKYMVLDAATHRNLELIQTLREGNKRGSLLWVLDKTVTAMGGRMLRQWVEQPLVEKKVIEQRLDVVDELVNDLFFRSDLRESLNEIYDLERLVSKIVYGTVNAKDMIALKTSLLKIPLVKELLNNAHSEMLIDLNKNLCSLNRLTDLLNDAIEDNPPFSLREGGIIKNGYHPEVDKLREARSKGKTWIASLETKEKERSGIRSLKVGFNKVFGYYIEVTKANLHLVPDDYQRKQTLANGERFITPQLKEYESLILGAEEKVIELEYQLFQKIRGTIIQFIESIQHDARIIAQLDTLTTFAEVAVEENYCKPVITDEDAIHIKEGRHPIVEKVLHGDSFVPNDVYLDENENRFLIITGPNMAGKSTYMRQVALIVLMAQIGSFVPALQAEIGIVDRIFTRVGASDDLVSGQSTFMVEMNEVSNILNHATSKSLIILDEIGRGTSTFDGLSIAWAVVEYINNPDIIGAKTLFATHYHELTVLEDHSPSIKNYSVAIKEKGEDIIFLRKIISGGADRSYGIQVARLAGLPKPVIERAKTILNHLESDQNGKENRTQLELPLFVSEEPSINDPSPILEELKSLNVMHMTPLQALNTLYELQEKAKKE